MSSKKISQQDAFIAVPTARPIATTLMGQYNMVFRMVSELIKTKPTTTENIWLW